MNAVSHLSPGAAVSTYVRPPVQAARPGPAGGAGEASRGPAVMLGGGLASVAAIAGAESIGGARGVTPVPPVKPVVYRPGSAVNLSV